MFHKINVKIVLYYSSLLCIFEKQKTINNTTFRILQLIGDVKAGANLKQRVFHYHLLFETMGRRRSERNW